MEAEKRPQEIIDTTSFSVILNCEYYKERKKIENQVQSTGLKHIKTFHAENYKVPAYQKVVEKPIYYFPYFMPAPPIKKKPPVKRKNYE